VANYTVSMSLPCQLHFDPEITAEFFHHYRNQEYKIELHKSVKVHQTAGSSSILKEFIIWVTGNQTIVLLRS